jgi:hypothetical protein
VTRVSLADLQEMGKLRASRQTLRYKIGDVILCSTAVQARIESLDPKTGEYRIALEGTLDKENSSLTP